MPFTPVTPERNTPDVAYQAQAIYLPSQANDYYLELQLSMKVNDELSQTAHEAAFQAAVDLLAANNDWLVVQAGTRTFTAHDDITPTGGLESWPE